ncbi:MAG: phosphopantetheine-binding protein [Syntrophus sp. (in: bacteria)]
MDVKAIVKQYIVMEIMHQPEESVLDDEASLIEGGIIDSMSLFELIIFLEEKFGITINEEEVDIENFQTVQALVNFINKKMHLS